MGAGGLGATSSWASLRTEEMDTVRQVAGLPEAEVLG